MVIETLVDFALQEKYAKVKKLKSRLAEMEKLIDWERFIPLFPERESLRGRPNYEKVLMVKLLFLQSWYTLSDEELEYQVYDRLSFQQFLGFPKNIPDYSTVWRFREALAEDGLIDGVWDELERQIEEKHITVEEGMIQDASFIIADPGKKNSGMQGRGRLAKTSRNKDASWTKKGNNSYFGYKGHTKVGEKTKLIKEVAVTTAKTSDSAIDLATANDVIYRDKGYTGVKSKAKGNGSMKRGNLSIKEILRNKRIEKKRARGEHPYGTIKRSFKGGTTKLTELHRVFVQYSFVCMAYNLHRLATLVSM